MIERHTFILLLISTVLIAMSMATNPYSVFFTSDSGEGAPYGLWNLHQQFEALPIAQKKGASPQSKTAPLSISQKEDNTIILGSESSTTWPPEAAIPLGQ